MILRYDGARRRTWGYRFVAGAVLYKRRGFLTKGIAEDAEAAARQEVAEARGPVRRPILTPWPEAIERYEAAKAGKADLVEHDRPRLAWWGRFLTAHGVDHLQTITPAVLDQAKTAMTAAGLSGATQQRYLAVLKHLCQLACRRWTVGVPPRPLLDYNPVFGIDWPTANGAAPRVPTVAHVRKVLAAAAPWLRPLILVAVYTGFRAGSLLRLEVADCQARAGQLRAIQKGGRPVFLPVRAIPELASALARLEHAAGSGRLFRWPDGRLMRRFPRKAWGRARRGAGLPWLGFHALRHLTGTLLAEANVPPRIIQAWLGHTTGRMTEHYTQTVRLQQAARVLGRRRLT